MPKVHTCFSRWCWSAAVAATATTYLPLCQLTSCRANPRRKIGHGPQRLSKLMRDAKCAHDLAVYTVPSSCVWVSAADAAWKNRPYGTTSSGRLVGRGRVLCVDLEVAEHSPSGAQFFGCWSAPRSRLGCNVQISFSLLRVMWTLLCGDLVGLDQYEAFLQATDVVCINDCKGVADAKQRLAVRNLLTMS